MVITFYSTITGKRIFVSKPTEREEASAQILLDILKDSLDTDIEWIIIETGDGELNFPISAIKNGYIFYTVRD